MRKFLNRLKFLPLLAGISALVGCAQGPTAPSAPARAVNVANPASDWHARQGELVKRRYGIEVVSMRRLASGWMLEFRYRVLDPEKAVAFGNDHVRPFLIHELTGAKLAVPSMENIGELRQTGRLKADRDYYILFGNANQLVHSGDRVTVIVGTARIEGLVVEQDAR